MTQDIQEDYFLMRNAYSYLSSIKIAGGSDSDEQAYTQLDHVTPPAPDRNHEMLIMTSPPFSIFSPVNIFKSHNKIFKSFFLYRNMSLSLDNDTWNSPHCILGRPDAKPGMSQEKSWLLRFEWFMVVSRLEFKTHPIVTRSFIKPKANTTNSPVTLPVGLFTILRINIQYT